MPSFLSSQLRLPHLTVKLASVLAVFTVTVGVLGCQVIDPTAPRSWELTSIAYMPFSVQESLNKGTEYVGVTSLPRRSAHVIVFKPRFESREFNIFTCGREEFLEIPKGAREFKYSYVPTWRVESEEVCPLYAVNISPQGNRETAVIDFNNHLYNGKARVYCNGKTADVVGTHLCQVRESFYLGLRFDKAMIVEFDKGCNPPTKLKFYEWEIKASKGHCNYFFAASPSEVFRLLVRGYESKLEATQ